MWTTYKSMFFANVECNVSTVNKSNSLTAPYYLNILIKRTTYPLYTYQRKAIATNTRVKKNIFSTTATFLLTSNYSTLNHLYATANSLNLTTTTPAMVSKYYYQTDKLTLDAITASTHISFPQSSVASLIHVVINRFYYYYVFY